MRRAGNCAKKNLDKPDDLGVYSDFHLSLTKFSFQGLCLAFPKLARPGQLLLKNSQKKICHTEIRNGRFG